MRPFSLPRRATSATSGMHDKFHLCLQQRCANCITQDFLLRPRRSYFWKWSQGQHKCHHGCVWTTKMGKEKTTVQARNTRSQTNTELPAFFHFNTSDLLAEPHLAKDGSVTAQVLHKIGSKFIMCWRWSVESCRKINYINVARLRLCFMHHHYAMQLLHLRSRSWRDSTPPLQSQANLVSSKRFHVDTVNVDMCWKYQSWKRKQLKTLRSFVRPASPWSLGSSREAPATQPDPLQSVFQILLAFLPHEEATGPLRAPSHQVSVLAAPCAFSRVDFWCHACFPDLYP